MASWTRSPSPRWRVAPGAACTCRGLSARPEFADWTPSQPLRDNRFGIGEPTGPARALKQLDLLLLPLVGFSDDGGRLGMGGGFYDRTLGALKLEERPLLLGLAYAAQQVEILPMDPWDVRLDGVLTERGLLRCSERMDSGTGGGGISGCR